MNSLTKVQQTCALFSQIYQPSIGHYFRNLYHIVVSVDSSNVENKAHYIKILRAQLASDELLLLFYNGLSNDGYTKFKPLIEKYSLLERVDTEPMWGRLFDREHVQLYESTAFHDCT